MVLELRFIGQEPRSPCEFRNVPDLFLRLPATHEILQAPCRGTQVALEAVDLPFERRRTETLAGVHELLDRVDGHVERQRVGSLPGRVDESLERRGEIGARLTRDGRRAPLGLQVAAQPAEDIGVLEHER